MKRAITALLALLIVLSLTACGGGNQTSPSAAPTETPVNTPAPTSAPTVSPAAAPTPEPTPESTPEPTPEPLAFADEHGWRFEKPTEFTIPVAQYADADNVEYNPVTVTYGAPEISRTEPDGEGFITYTVTYSSPAKTDFNFDGTEIRDAYSQSNDYLLFDYYTGTYIHPGLSAVYGGNDSAGISATIEYEGDSFDVYYSVDIELDEGEYAAEPSGNGYHYTSYSDGTYTMTIRVPQAYDGLVIGLDHITMPDPLSDNDLFISEWDDDANLDNWVFVRLCDHVTVNLDGILFSEDMTELVSYPMNKYEKHYTIPEGVTTIGSYAFKNSSLSSIAFPDSITMIDDHAFFGCWNLESCIIPEGVTEIADGLFFGCGKLVSVEIPESVTVIGKEAFYYCYSLNSIIIPDGVRTIDNRGFLGCDLISIMIPGSVEEIGSQAFYGNNSLTDVYYAGSESDWKMIKIEDYNESLTDATIHFNSNGPD